MNEVKRYRVLFLFLFLFFVLFLIEKREGKEESAGLIYIALDTVDKTRQLLRGE